MLRKFQIGMLQSTLSSKCSKTRGEVQFKDIKK